MTEALRAPKETDSRASASRALPIPAIVTNLATGSSSTLKRNGSNLTINKDSGSPNEAKPGLLRTSQSFPIGSAPSDVGSSLSGNPLDTRKNSRSGQGQSNASIGVTRSSLSSPTLVEVNADSSAIDPLSQHIIKRTNTEKSIPLKLLGRASYEAEAGGTDRLPEQDPIRGDAALHRKPSKKGVSFLSRIIGGKKKDQILDDDDDVSEPDTARMDTTQPIGFFPRVPRPPKYIRVRAHYKKEKTFSRVFVAQELEGADDVSNSSEKDGSSSVAGARSSKNTGKAVWALVFSNDGKYLAAAGQDGKVRVWAVITSPEDRHEPDLDEDGSQHSDEPPQLKAPVFKAKPVQVYEGHIGSVLDLSWSKNNFLLSSSMDKTVRLWHVSRPECLCIFKHSDFVTSIQFHPRDDRFFLAGSLDTKLRLWSIPDKSVAFMVTVPDMITSVAFTPDGRHSIAGCLNGMCNIYETDGLKPITQFHVRSARGRNAKGSKITGIDTAVFPKGDPQGEVKLLITSNDSRIRMYNFRDRTLEAKFRGNENTCSQIRASFSDDGKHVICGSEDRRAYLWPTAPIEKDSDKRAVEVVEPQSAMVTVAIMAPSKTKQTLGFSEDPIYDFCNPPPVTLGSSKGNGTRRNSVASKQAQESPAYLARSTHPGGNILIVADYSGKIKILRQDCAYHKRRFESWDTHSTISRRLLRRTNSARHSIASSIGKESSHKTPSERIISWRNSVIGHTERKDGHHPGTRTRSPSPQRLADRSQYSSPKRRGSRSGYTISPPPSAYKTSTEYKTSLDSAASTTEVPGRSGAANAPNALQAASLLAADKQPDEDNPLWLQGDHSYAFYKRIAGDALAVRNRESPRLLDPNRLSVPARRQPSVGSVLSSDYASSNGEGDESEDVLRCDNCEGTNFRATKGRNGKQKLICARCSNAID
ncbi:WD40-repeat-containing domain protein [Aspergillus pseudonomiae]|uniref:WD40-repeat-containing domain protein n=1 Tax=Aspergillus pseudonomiae TaxID=1506151 RepID=A0A5N6HP97_9EURO|nr:WD40-repeat-containing domain protein [Aspergillus pseudonomiae]KAB8255509.1 WD40-repeat-containing domain protein [Aspergillus pseudonomiae]KAE8408023.1 WD40-repeat-containing domain protein [Aspergillus pseudonomiae]